MMGFAPIVKVILLAQIFSYAATYDECFRQFGVCQPSTDPCPGGTIVHGEYLCGDFGDACCYPPSVIRESCTCNLVKENGCTLGGIPIKNTACRCDLTGPLTFDTTKCRGHVVECNDKDSQYCKNPKMDYDTCKQGVFGELGNCCGYPEAGCPGVTSSDIYSFTLPNDKVATVGGVADEIGSYTYTLTNANGEVAIVNYVP